MSKIKIEVSARRCGKTEKMEREKRMQPVFINARDLNEAYFKLIYNCWEHGYKYEIDTGSYKGESRMEMIFAAGFIRFPHTRPLAPTMPEGLSPTTTDEKIEEYFTNYLMNPQLEPHEEYRYSSWINGRLPNYYLDKFETFESQLDWCIRHFKEKGFGNNHCYITIGDPTINFNYDIPYKNETERKTSPCLRGIDIKIKDNKVILGVVFRSWDLYSGFPENMGGFALLNQYVAEQLGIEPGPLTFASQGLHIYSFQIKPVLTYLRKE